VGISIWEKKEKGGAEDSGSIPVSFINGAFSGNLMYHFNIFLARI
jgi:hypothetical protein